MTVLSIAGAIAGALTEGAQLALQFNPVVALITDAIAAASYGYPRVRVEARWRMALVLVVGWLIGGGLLVVGRARELADGASLLLSAGPTWAAWLTIATWALGSMAIGYLVPALVGAAVGRRVTHGTGWLAAAFVAGTLAMVFSSVGGAVA